MSQARKIKDFISELPDDTIFTSRELLHLGSRNAVDTTTHRMVYMGELKRLARGVFMKDLLNQRIPSVVEVAVVKAKAFGKEVFQHGINAASEIGLIDKKIFKRTRFLFYTNGCSSSFQTAFHTVRFQAVSKRKTKISKTDAGKIIKAVWQLGKNKAQKSRGKARYIEGNLSRLERLAFRKEVRGTPSWLYEIFYPKSRIKKALGSA